MLAGAVCLQPVELVLLDEDFVQLLGDHHHVRCHLLLALDRTRLFDRWQTWGQG